MKSRQACAALGVILCGTAAGAAEDVPVSRVFAETQQAYGTDEYRSSAWYAGYRRGGPLPEQWLATVALGHVRYDSPVGVETFLGVRGGLGRPLGERTTIALEGQQLLGSAWDPTVGTLTLSHAFTEHWAAEARAAHDIIATVPGIRLHNASDGLSLLGSYKSGARWSADVSGAAQWVDDGNRILDRSLKLSYQPERHEWLELQLRAHRSDSEQAGAGYFSPRRLEEAVGVARTNWLLDGDRLKLTAEAGGGAQRVDGINPQVLYVAEVGAQLRVGADYGVEAKLGCSNLGAATGQPAGSDYLFCSGNVAVLRAF